MDDREKTLFFVRRLIAIGLLTPQQVPEINQLGKQYRQQGQQISISDVLIRHKYIEKDAVSQMQKIFLLGKEDFEFAQAACRKSVISLQELAYCSESLVRAYRDGRYHPLSEWLLKERIIDNGLCDDIQAHCSSRAAAMTLHHFSGDLAHIVKTYSLPQKDGICWSIGRIPEAHIRLYSLELHGIEYAQITCEAGKPYLSPGKGRNCRISLNFCRINGPCELRHYDYIGIGENDVEILVFKTSEHGSVRFEEKQTVRPEASLGKEKIERYVERFHGLLEKVNFKGTDYLQKLLALLRFYSLVSHKPFRPSSIARANLQEIGELLLCYACRIAGNVKIAILGYWPAGKLPIALNCRSRLCEVSVDQKLIITCLKERRAFIVRESDAMAMVIPLFEDEDNRAFLFLRTEKMSAVDARRRVLTLLAQAPSMGAAVLDAIAIQKMKDKSILEDELEKAEKTQGGLMTDIAIPYLQARCHYRQTLKIGGDYCDIIPSPWQSGSYFLVIADAMGHGIRAAFMVTSFRSYLRSLIANKNSLSDALVAAHKFLYADFKGFPYLMALVLHWDAIERKLSWIDAGFQCRPLLLKAGANAHFCVPSPKGSILGTKRKPEFTEQAVALSPGDTLLVYTDGIVEAKSPHGKEFGEEKLKQIFERNARKALGDLLDCIYREVADFAQLAMYERLGGVENLSFWAEEWDDVTLLALRSETLPGPHQAVFQRIE